MISPSKTIKSEPWLQVLIQSLVLSHSAVKAIAANREAQKLRICCMFSLSLPPQTPQLRTTQFQFIKLLLVCFIFYIHYCFHCFPLFQLFQTCSSLSRSFTKSYPQNCTELSSLTIAEQSSVITSCALQAELLFIHPSTAFASFSTTNNHVQLVTLFYVPQSFSAEL